MSSEQEIRARQLVARLYAEQGKPFNRTAAGAAPLSPSAAAPASPSGRERKASEQKSLTIDAADESLTFTGTLATLKAKKSKHSPTQSPTNLAGTTRSLLPLLSKAVESTAAAASPKARSMLETQHTLPASESIAAPFGGESLHGTSKSTLASISSAARLSAGADASETEEEKNFKYQQYLKSPFSLIDRIIADPTTDEFVYLNPKSGPYELEIVPHTAINKSNYYTMSRHGVTHFYQQETSFITLAQWEREYTLFTRMMKIPFFHKFRMWKAFVFWKRWIRSTKGEKCRKVLQDSLYMLNEQLCGSLVELRELCYEVSKWPLFKLESKQVHTLSLFQSSQEQQQQQVSLDLTQLGDEVRHIVLKACETDLREFLIANGFRKRKKGDGGDVEEYEDFPQKISHAERAAIRTKCRKLTKYIRLADYFIIDTLVSLCMERAQDLLRAVEYQPQQTATIEVEDEKCLDRNATPAPGKEEKGDCACSQGAMFSIEVKLDEDQQLLYFSPPLEDFQSALESSIVGVVKRLMSPQRLLGDEEFQQYTQVNVDESEAEGNNNFQLEMMVLQDEGFMQTVSGIKRALAAAFEAARKYALGFERFKDVYFVNNSTDLEKFRDADINVLTELIERYEREVAEFDNMPTQSNIGIIQVDSSVLKEHLTPSPKRCLEIIQQLLPSVARDKTQLLLDELVAANNKVSSIPASVEEFVEIMAFLAQTKNSMEDTEARYTFILQIYKLMQVHEIRVSDSEKAVIERLTQALSTFKMSLTFCETSSQGNAQRFSKELENDIPALITNVEKLKTELTVDSVRNPEADVDEVISFLEERNEQLAALEDTGKRYQSYQQVLEVPVVQYDDMGLLRAHLDTLLSLWTAVRNWKNLTTQWMTSKFADIDVDEITKQIHVFSKICGRASMNIEDHPLIPMLKERVAAFQHTMPVVIDLRNKELQDRHWLEIGALFGPDFHNDEHLSLGTLIELNAMAHKGAISAISTKASQEAALKTMLEKIQNTWADLNFGVLPYKGQKDVYILSGLDDIITPLEESLVNINTIMGSRFVEPIREEVTEWNAKLILFQETLDEWTTCQRAWMYLESIFSAQDIVRQLPEESATFAKVDKGWKDVMQRTSDNPNALHACTLPGVKENFQSWNAVLELVQKKLEQYLETKRMAFPRFYFLSNDELLEILAQSKNVNAVQAHLRKCFDGLVKLELQDKDIVAMFSPEGERVPLGRNKRHTQARSSVEVWLTALEADMMSSLKRFIKKGVVDYERSPRKTWVLEKFAQVVMTVSQIAWCRGCEAALRSDNPKKAMAQWYDTQIKQLSELTQLVRGNLSKIDRKKIVALVTTDVHARDVVANLKDSGVSHVNDFNWQQQLRLYWDQEMDDCIVRQSNAMFRYGYEYMGVSSRLVITPLTDRCWMTVTGALHIRFGAAPAGPAGTGKTESVKDLAKGMGIFCVVFNCSDQIDYKMMGKLFSGLAQTGAWACLDEFNRIDIEVLSVIAQQLMQVRQGLLQNASHFIFQGTEIPLKDTFGVMITMNPGYAGRTELPDNLKVLFRPVSMMIPDYALIAEIMLFAEGFDQASILSKKMVQLYKLSSEQLSQQDHYDFGMRAVKSVLVMAGALKRSEPDLPEDVVLIRAMRDSNVPKFLSDDLPLFHAIINDLFPKVHIPHVDYGELKLAIHTVLDQMGLQPVPSFVTKVIQLFETFNVRFGVMLVGPTGAGKSACYNVLAGAMKLLRAQGSTNEAYQEVFTHVLNSKCITMGELYGEVDPITQEWSDGLASSIMREAIKDGSENKHWVVFDGPVDALWIENMNTVLDDNMTLCLANGERIKLKQELRMLFEVQDLAVASPATVSRCGMVYMTPGDLGYLPYAKSWVQRWAAVPDQATKDYIYSLFELCLPEGLGFLRSNGEEPIRSTDLSATTSLCFMLESLLTAERGVQMDAGLEALKPLIDMLFSFAFVWSVGGASTVGCQISFSKFCNEKLPSHPPGTNVFDYYVDIKDRAWMSWENKVPEFKYSADVPFFQMLVPTVDTVRYSSLMELCVDVQRSVFFTGVTGVGKSVVVTSLFNRIKDEKKIMMVPLNFSAQTDSRKTQETIEGKLVKLRKNLLGAPAGKKVVIFVDDVNMPSVEEYGAQPPIELLRQFQDFKGFYDRKKLFWKSVQDTTLVCAAAPPGGGRSELTARFMRHFTILCLPPPSEAIMKRIFSAILGGFLANGFKQEVQQLCNPIIASTVELYGSICKELLPTPAKSHYTFNLRDVSKVVQGILMSKPNSVGSSEVMTRLWIHEAQRCFYDRLTNDDDKLWFTQKAVSLVKKNFGLSWTHEELFEKGTIMFGGFLRPGGDHIYEEAKDMDKVAHLLDKYLEEYNMTHSSNVKLVFFEDAVRHVARICRILMQPRGNAMLVGVGGSGKQSLTRLACYMSEQQCLSIELTRGFCYSDFQDHLKKLMNIAGVQGKQVAFLFTENQIIDERYLEDVNNILNSGEVPNLFAPDELQKVIDDMTPVVRQMGLPENRDVVYQTFVNRVRDNLHIVLCMSPVGDSFRTRCRKFPSLINCTTIDWFNPWPKQALLSVSQRFLKDIPLPNEQLREALSEICVDIHVSVEEVCRRFYAELRRRVYTTPKSYLDLIALYVSMLQEKREQLTRNKSRLDAGLTKLRETNEMVVELKETLVKLQPELVKKTEETEELLKQVAVDQERAAEVREVVESEEKLVKQQAEEVSKIQADAQADLDLALPALNAAIKALDSLKKSDIAEVKAMAKPPPGVVMVMEAVCIMFDEKPDWESAKKVMNNVNFLKNLKDFDKDNIKPPTIKKLQKYVTNPSFTEEVMKKVSIAATSLCSWVKAMVIYSKVAKDVEPKKQRVAEMNAMLEEANSKLQEKQNQLSEVSANVARLKQKCDETVAEKARLDKQSNDTRERLVRAEKLTTLLAEEAIRWAKESKRIGGELEVIVGNAFLSAACVSYFGAFTGEYRHQLIEMWLAKAKEKGIPVSDEFTLRGTLGDPVAIRQWGINGLPTDDVSIDSGILVVRGQRWPLMIDPQGQAKQWIKNEYKSRLVITRFTDPNLLRVLENGIRNGQPVLIEDIGESLDASIDPVLLKQVYAQGGGSRLMLRLGETDIDYDPNFRLFMTTKLPNPHYMPEICIKVTLLNFTVTKTGLEDQLLGEVVKKERADIEDKKNRLVVSMAADRKILSDLEEKILRMLSESSGMILDDIDLIDTLSESKTTANVINERVTEATQMQADISVIREKYRPAAIRGSILYFVISDLSLIDPMYQNSLSSFMRLFNMCIENSEQSNDLDTRLHNLISYMTDTIFSNICRGVFESHKLIFSFMIAAQILRDRSDISTTAWNLLLRGPSPGQDRPRDPNTRVLSNPHLQVFSGPGWTLLNAVDFCVPSCSGVTKHICDNLELWKSAIHDGKLVLESTENAEGENIFPPAPWSSTLTPFEKLVLLKACREDKLLAAFAEFVKHHMGPAFLAAANRTRLEDVYKDTDCKTPVVFVLSAGADPTGVLLRFAKEMNYSDRLNIISLGQGQGEAAKAVISEAAANGDWALLQNCHLAKSFMPELEKIVEGFHEREDKINPSFRLWLTSMPCDYFPVPVLQSSVKLTNEPPQGLRENLNRSYKTVISADDFEKCSKPEAWKKLLMGLCFFHACVQERKKFGPLGWNKMYEFNDSDLETSIQVLRMFLDEQPQVPWDALRYVSGQINYGGRVTDDWDRRCLMSILSRFITPQILEPNYFFSPSHTYYAPAAGPLDSYLKYIQSLPAYADPEIFGMHENANITYQRQEADKILSTIVSIQPREVGSDGGKTPDQIVAESAFMIEAKLPPLLDRKDAGPNTFVMRANKVEEGTDAPKFTLDSLATVLLQEMERFNKLLRVMKSSLSELQKAIKGEVVMSAELDKMYSSILNNQVPDLWARHAYPSLKPLGSWIKDLHQRIHFMGEWLRNGQPLTFWLSGFFFPQGFLTGTLQNFARKYQVPIDSLNFNFRVLDAMDERDIKAGPSDGVYIRGLFIDGARWDSQKKMIVDSHLGELQASMPVIHFIPSVDIKHETNPFNYICPVYKTSVRAGVLSTTGQSTNFVVAVSLPSAKESDYWILKGAAILCQLND